MLEGTFIEHPLKLGNLRDYKRDSRLKPDFLFWKSFFVAFIVDILFYSIKTAFFEKATNDFIKENFYVKIKK